MLPKLFIGSSQEASDAGLLDTLQNALNDGLNSPPSIELVLWNNSPWKNLTVAVQSLVENLVDYSYGVFILSPDDEVLIREEKQYAARDNVIFEFGLFLAHLGLERTFIVGPANGHKTIATSAVKTTAPHTTSPPELPLRIFTDLGSAYRKGSYKIKDPGPSPTITFQVADVIKAIKAVEAKTSGLDSSAADTELKRRLLKVKAENDENGKGNAYYSGQFFSHFRDIATLKAKATTKSVQGVVEDLRLHLERFLNLCDMSQLALEQHHSRGVSKVWVFADHPLEFRPGMATDPAFKALRQAIIENLEKGIPYVYFVGPAFDETSINHLVDPLAPNRDKMLSCIDVVQVNSQFFSTYFTLHFGVGHDGPTAIYMSSVMRGRKDVLIQVSDNDHVQRIYERICVLHGKIKRTGSPRITSHVL